MVTFLTTSISIEKREKKHDSSKTLNMFIPSSSVPIVDFEQVNINWEVSFSTEMRI